jgi:hypothetical protein
MSDSPEVAPTGYQNITSNDELAEMIVAYFMAYALNAAQNQRPRVEVHPH